MTFEVKQSITFVATHPLVILTKFGRNPIKHVEEEANCEKEEEEEEEESSMWKKKQIVRKKERRKKERRKKKERKKEIARKK